MPTGVYIKSNEETTAKSKQKPNRAVSEIDPFTIPYISLLI